MGIDISIIIVNYNVRHFIKRTIESIYASQTSGVSYDITVVDNASIDGSIAMIRETFPDVHLIANQDNVGFSTANNQAIRIAKGRYILILNPDTIIEEDTLNICLRHMDANRSAGAMGVKMIDGAGNFLPESKRDLPTIWNSFTKLAGLAQLFPKSKLFNGYALGYLDEDAQHKIKVLCGAFMFVRRSVIDQVGMFDERFFMYGEDIDWSRRIIEGGHEIHYVPDTTIIHYKGESTKKASLNYVKTFYGAMGLYVEKHYTGSSGKWFSYFLKAGIVIRALMSSVKRLILFLIWPVLDLIFISLLVFAFSRIWATYYFANPGYYVESRIQWNIFSYAFAWVFSLWFVGYYQKSDWKKRAFGIFSGLGLILAMYALLPDQLRSSRVIILIGAGISMVSTSIVAWVMGRGGNVCKPKSILIVADKEHATEIKAALSGIKEVSAILGVVSPTPLRTSDLDYLNDISELAALSKVLKADEIIFSSESMSMKSIMKMMMTLDTKLSFKIAGDDSLSILGSSSKNTTGELYNVDIKYNLEQGYYRHTKRMFDIIVAILMLIFLPIVVVLNGFALGSILYHIGALIIGSKTAIGYRGDSAAYQNLPQIESGIIPILEGRDDRNANMHYAREYSVWKDIDILKNNLKHLS